MAPGTGGPFRPEVTGAVDKSCSVLSGWEASIPFLLPGGVAAIQAEPRTANSEFLYALRGRLPLSSTVMATRT